jgi:hypothetical protein
MLSKLCQNGCVKAFEKNLVTKNQLCGNLFINDCKNVKSYTELLGRENSSYVKKLDKFQFANVQLIKINTGGYDFNIIVGAESTIKYNKPTILFKYDKKLAKEFKIEFKNIYDYLHLLNYEIYNIFADCFIDYIAIHNSVHDEIIEKLKNLKKSDLQYVGRTHRNCL